MSSLTDLGTMVSNKYSKKSLHLDENTREPMVRALTKEGSLNIFLLVRDRDLIFASSYGLSAAS